jgi:hypothetical protein
MAVKQWLQEQSLRTMYIDVLTLGPHARRSGLLYEKALGNAVNVGVIAIEDRRFDSNLPLEAIPRPPNSAQTQPGQG